MNGQLEGTQGYQIGNLKRQLRTVPIFLIDPSESTGSGNATARLVLRGLNGNLKLMVGVGMQQPGSSSQSPYVWPSGGGTVQIYPATKFGDSPTVFFRPVFQDPTATDNGNHPLPQELPFGWEGAFTEADQLMIEVVVDRSVWTGGLAGQIVCQVTVEYNGLWQDRDAMAYAMGQVQLSGGSDVISIGSGGD